MPRKEVILYTAFATIVVSVGLYYLIPSEDRTILNVLAIIGFVISLMGIIISYLQILSLKQIAEQTRLQVAESIKLNNDILMLTDLSRKSAMIDEIQIYLRDNKIELCILRMKDLKIVLNTLKSISIYKPFFNRKEFTQIFENFNIDLSNFQNHRLNNANSIDKTVIMLNLDKLASFFQNVEIKLKSQTHDS